MPSALETARFGQWLLCTRFAQSVAEPKLLRRTRDTVEVYLKHAQGHLWRVLYPRMQMMPESEWRAYWALVNQKFHGVFTQLPYGAMLAACATILDMSLVPDDSAPTTTHKRRGGSTDPLPREEGAHLVPQSCRICEIWGPVAHI